MNQIRTLICQKFQSCKTSIYHVLELAHSHHILMKMVNLHPLKTLIERWGEKQLNNKSISKVNINSFQRKTVQFGNTYSRYIIFFLIYLEVSNQKKKEQKEENKLLARFKSWVRKIYVSLRFYNLSNKTKNLNVNFDYLK